MHLLVFCDGTWNTPDQVEDGLPAPTNVWKMRNALAETDADGRKQVSYYHQGVGTDGGWWNRIAGGGMGEGLDKNIMSAYNWLARHYEPGATIWLFGFSRGAYTVRSLGGMINRCGLLNPAAMKDADAWTAIESLFANYREPAATAEPVVATQKLRFHGVKTGDKCKASIPIHFIGVWDTVGALGVPDDMALLNLLDNPAKHSFHDTALSAIVAHARHAIAIDEKRRSFIPTLWTNVADRPTVQQVWFPGVHGDVGGGYGRCGLSDGALAWMIEETRKLGLGFRANIEKQIAADAGGVLHDSVTGVFKSLRTLPRDVPAFLQDNGRLHQSARDRHNNPPLSQRDYWRTKLLPKKDAVEEFDIYARERWNHTGLFLEAGVTYRFTAKGEWVDGETACPPTGAEDRKFQLEDIARAAGSLWGQAEELYKTMTGNRQVDFWYSRRVENAPWFSLIGVVANGVLPETKPDEKKTVDPHETFEIGKGTTFTPKESGYFYAFANDAWHTYENNRGSVHLVVKRQS